MRWEQYTGASASIEEFKELVKTLPPAKPSWIQGWMVHNTALPNLPQAEKTPDTNKDKDPFDDRVRNTAAGYKKKGWVDSGGIRGPHIFTASNGRIYLGTHPTRRGIHSPGYNNKFLAGEMFGDYRKGVDDDDAGGGLVVKDAMCKAIAIVFDYWGIEPNNTTIKLHKEDPKTTHDCPGNDIEKADIIARVKQYMDELDLAGEHDPIEAQVDLPNGAPAPYEEWTAVVNVTPDDTLNLREQSGTGGKLLSKLPRGVKLTVMNEAKNADTTWLYVRTPMGFTGWVSAKFVAYPAANQPSVAPPPLVSAPAPTPAAPAPASPPTAPVEPTAAPSGPVTPGLVGLAEPGVPVLKDHNDVAMALLTGLPVTWKGQGPRYWLRDYGFEPYTVNQAAGLVGNLMRESYARLVTTAVGDTNTAYGIGQWRNERQAALRAFARVHGRQVDDLITQLLYAVHELQVDDETDEVYAGKLLRASKTLEEATAAGVVFERPKGWIRPKNSDGSTTYDLGRIVPAAKRGDGWYVRLENAAQMVQEYEVIKGR